MQLRVRYYLITCAILLLYILTSIFDQFFIFTDDFFIEKLSGEFSESFTDSFMSSENRIGWLTYIAIPLVILVKMVFVTFCITVGAIFANIDFKFYDIIRSAILAEFIFLISNIHFSLKLFLNVDYLTFDNTLNFFPFSMISFFGTENVTPWLHYPLQTLNLFEVFYVLFISWLLSKQWKPNFIESLNIVIPSYGIGLLLWMTLVVFLTLQIS